MCVCVRVLEAFSFSGVRKSIDDDFLRSLSNCSVSKINIEHFEAA